MTYLFCAHTELKVIAFGHMTQCSHSIHVSSLKKKDWHASNDAYINSSVNLVFLASPAFLTAIHTDAFACELHPPYRFRCQQNRTACAFGRGIKQRSFWYAKSCPPHLFYPKGRCTYAEFFPENDSFGHTHVANLGDSIQHPKVEDHGKSFFCYFS